MNYKVWDMLLFQKPVSHHIEVDLGKIYGIYLEMHNFI